MLKVHLPYHESDHVLNLTYNVMCGGTRLEDIERLRPNPPLPDGAYLPVRAVARTQTGMNALNAKLIPDPTTAGDFTRRFREADVIGLMDCINAVRPKLWRTRAASFLEPVAYIDVDGTTAPTYGEKKGGMDISYKGVWGYAPLIVSLANTKEVLYVVNRPGNASSHQGASWIDAAIALVKPHAQRLCLRGDTDFSLTGHFDRWAKDTDFIFGMDCNSALRTRAEALDEANWQRLHSASRAPEKAANDNEKQRIVKARGYLKLALNFEDVAEFDYQPGKCERPYRVVALRKNISKTKGQQTLFDDIRYFFYITTRDDLTPAEVVFAAMQTMRLRKT